MFLIFVIPGGADLHLRKDGEDTRQGWAIFAAFSVMFLIGVFVCYHFEQAGNPILAKLGIQTAATPASPAATWKARRSASASPTPRCSPP